MKKQFLVVLLILSTCFIFAKTEVLDVDEVEDVRKKGFLISGGDTFYYTKRLSMYSDYSSYPLYSNGFNIELGFFESDEDGFVDYVEYHTFGFSTGIVNTKNNYRWFDNTDICYSLEDAKYNNISTKELYGTQLNIFPFSVGILLGSNFGYDWMKMNSAFNGREFLYREHRVYLDFVVQPYVSVNIARVVKIFIASDFDFPITRLRFIENSPFRNADFKWDWFSNDIPTTYKAGVVIFF